MHSAEVLVFPSDRRTALVRKTAQSLAVLHGEAANIFWRSAARELYRDLMAMGHDDASARVDIARFSDSVQCALRDMSEPALSSITA